MLRWTSYANDVEVTGMGELHVNMNTTLDGIVQANGGPTEQDRSEGMPSLGEAPNERGKSALVTFALFESDSL